jgi:hypothetical protein
MNTTERKPTKKKLYAKDIRASATDNTFVCAKHPRYRMTRRPTSKCLVCQLLYEATRTVSLGPRETQFKMVEGVHGL